jgi:hypothetical protein
MMDVIDTEKGAATNQEERTPSEDKIDLDEIGEVNGYLADVNIWAGFVILSPYFGPCSQLSSLHAQDGTGDSG